MTKPVSKPDLQLAFDVGHSSLGWAVLQNVANQPTSINLLGCGVVTFRADDCLASARRGYRRQRRHIRSTRQRIARIKILLAHLGVLTKEHLDHPGCAWPWLLAARVLRGGPLLTWPELWDVLRWYAHNRGYDGNRRWSKQEIAPGEPTDSDDSELERILSDASATEDEKNDAKKVKEAKTLMRNYGVKTMAEAFCAICGLNPLGKKKSCNLPGDKRPKGMNAAFPRAVVEGEVRRIIRAHFGARLPKVDESLERVLLGRNDQDALAWQAIPCPGLKLPLRYQGALLFGQLVPRFDNRIIATCPITHYQEHEKAIEAIRADNPAYLKKHSVNLAKHDARWWAKHIADKLAKVPSRDCVEFMNFRWGMQLANIRVARFSEQDLSPLKVEERKQLDNMMRTAGAMAAGEFKKSVRQVTNAIRDNLDTMMMHPDAKDALVLDPVQKLIRSDDLENIWKLLPERLQKRTRGQWRQGWHITFADLRRQLAELGGDTAAFDVEVTRQVDTTNVNLKKKGRQTTTEELLKKPFFIKKLGQRAAFARPLLKQAYEEVMAGQHPKEKDGCLFISEEMREAQLQREIAQQTNNHLVRHRLLILTGNEKAKPHPKEGLLQHIIQEYAGGEETRVGKITIEVNRDLREMSGKSNYDKQADLNNRVKNHHTVVDYLHEHLPATYHNRINGSLIRKARVAADLDWKCPYTNELIQPIHLVTKLVDLDHVVPRALRPSDSLDSLVATFSVVNKMKGKRTAWQFIKDEETKSVSYRNEQGKEEKVDGMPNLKIRFFSDYKKFVDDLKIKAKGEHKADAERRERRQQLLRLATYEEKAFLPRDLTQTSQLVRLAAQALRRNLPHLGPENVVSLPGSVTGMVRKSWDVTGCLELACPQVMEDAVDKDGKAVRRAKEKGEIRGITHLHHALDACVIGFSSHFIPNNGGLWELMVKRRWTPAEESELEARGVFSKGTEGRFQMTDLNKLLKEQIRQRLAEKRVVQHIPARMDGLRVEQNTWRVVSVKDGEATLRQRIRQADGSRSQKTTEEKVTKLLGISPTGGHGKLKVNKGVLVIPENFGVALAKPEPVIIPFHKVWSRLAELKETNGGKLPAVLRNGQIIQVPNGRYKGVWRVFSAKATMTLDLGTPDKVRLESKGEDQKREVQVKTLIKDGMIVAKTSLTGISACPTTSSA